MGIWVSKMTNHTFRNALVVWFVVLIVSRESQSFTSARTRVTVLDTSGNVFPLLRPVRLSHSRPEHHLTSSHANSDNDPPNFRDEESNPLPRNHVPWSSVEDHELTSLIPLYTTPIASVNNIAIHATFWSELSSSSPLLSRRGRTEWDCRHRASQLFSKSGTANTNRQKHGTNSETWKFSPPLITDWEYTSSEPTDGSLTSIIRGFVNGRKVWFRVQEEGILEEVLSNTLEGKLTTLRIPYVVANGGRVVQLGTAAPATTTATISDHEGQLFLDNSASVSGCRGAVVLITVIPMLTLPSMSPPSLNGMTISSNAPIARTLSINQQQQQQQQRTQIQMPMLTRRASVVRVSLTMEEQVGRQQLRVKAAETRLQNWDSDVTQQQQPFFNLALRKEEMKLRELNQKLATTQRQTTQPTLTTPLQQRFL
mmetsp:Transcript_45102/g.54203  ORF Transcript_45102/g.54203 Transcript_45102/m.54203 type:complete len:425 (+) Transcript_45102:257-1531(+)